MKKPGVRGRIAELKQAAADKCGMERDEYIKMLVDTVRAHPGEASLDNPLCDVVFTRKGREATFPTKAAIGAQLAKLCGWNKETMKIEAAGDLSAFLRGVIGRRDPGDETKSGS
jgi:hypothetical protein